MTLWKLFGYRTKTSAYLWMLDVQWLIYAVVVACAGGVAIAAKHLPVWTLFLLPALLRTVRIKFIKSDGDVIAKFTHIWVVVPYRSHTQKVRNLAAHCSSDDLDEEDELVFGDGSGTGIQLEVLNLNATMDWVVEFTGLKPPFLRRDQET